MILRARKQVDSTDGENHENEGLEKADVEQTWDGGEECIEQHAHAFELMHRPERPQYSHCPKNLQARVIAHGSKPDHADKNNDEINPIPAITQVGFFVPYKTHRHNFENAFDQEDT